MMSKLQRSSLERLRSKAGSLAVFVEDRHLFFVQVNEITTDAPGIGCLITSVPTPGLAPLPYRTPDGTRIFASWEIFSEDDLAWHASYVSWDLIFDEQLIHEVRELADAQARAGRTVAFEEAWTAVRRFRLRQVRRLLSSLG